VRVEDVDARLVRGEAVPRNAELVEFAALGLGDEQTGEEVVFEDEASHAAVTRADDEGAERELLNLSAFDRHPSVIEVDDADVAGLTWRAVAELGVVAVNEMAVQVERDVVGADHDPVVRAVHEIPDEPRVRGDRVAAIRLRAARMARRRAHSDRQRRCHDQRKSKRAHAGLLSSGDPRASQDVSAAQRVAATSGVNGICADTP
jgi:hypothetical protein